VYEAKQSLRDLRCKYDVQSEQMSIYEQDTVPGMKLEMAQLKHKL
jgi:hypothetical protein